MIKNKLYMIKLILLMMITFICASCHQGSILEKLSGGYYYYDGGKPYKNILKTKVITSESLSCHINYLKKNIFSSVDDYSFDKEFILVFQKPSVEYYTKNMIFELEDICSHDRSVFIADSLLENDSYYHELFSRDVNYWIISIKKDSLYGPYSKEEYLNKRNELEVPGNLKLKNRQH